MKPHACSQLVYQQPRSGVVKPHVTAAKAVIGWMALGDARWEFFPMITDWLCLLG